MAPSKGFGRTGGRDGLWSNACPEMCIAVDSDSKAHSGPCYGGLGSAFQPLSAPHQRPGGCADTLTSIFSEPPCVPLQADMYCARCVGILGTPGLPRVLNPLDRLLDDLQWFRPDARCLLPTGRRLWVRAGSRPNHRGYSRPGRGCGY